MNKDILQKAATQVRGLSIDAVEACNSGHLGLPLGATEIGAILFGHALKFNPDNPHWLNRDRFILSAGHGSLFLYCWLHLSGYDLSLDEIRNFRKRHSRTPGHPESFMTAGVEATTGPLGQGVGNAVGIAVSSKMATARFNTEQYPIFDHHIVCLAGDGCLQEGISAEASSFAGHFGLDNLILIYDSNDVTLDAPADATQSEDVALRYKAYGFDTQTVDGNDMDAFLVAFDKAKTATTGRPQLIIAKTLIGKGIAEVAGTYKAHGEGGAKYAETARRSLGLPEEKFFISSDVYAYFAEKKAAREAEYQQWQKTFLSWQAAHPDLAKLLDSRSKQNDAEALFKEIPVFSDDTVVATRKAGAAVLQPLAKALPLIISGSADLHGSTLNTIKESVDFTKSQFAGRNIRFGIREHAMAAILNGFAYDGLFRASGATFATFSDYMRPAIRLAALSKLPVFYIFTHDSIGVGEDGPTHQPVEIVSALRLIPNLDVIRPGDPEETAGAFVAALERNDGPTAIILTRQTIPLQKEISLERRRQGVLKGGYIAKKEQEPLEYIIIATGSELQHAMKAATELGPQARVVSMPCCESFERQPSDYREQVLPSKCVKRIAIEAGVSDGWYKYVGLDGKVIGVDRFGISAPGAQVMTELGMTSEKVIEAAHSL